MADAARQPDDDELNPANRPRLLAIEGGAESDGAPGSRLTSVNSGREYESKKPPSPDELAEGESSGSTPAATDAENKEAQKFGSGGSSDKDDADWDTGLGEPQKGRGKFWTRKKGIGLGVVGLVVGGSIGVFSILQGPLQLLQLDFALGRNESGQQLAIGGRLKRMFYRSALQRNPDNRLSYGRTRLGAFSNRAFGNILNQLESDQGVKFLGDTGTFSGRPRLMSFNLARGSPLIGADAEATKLNIAREFGVEPSRVSPSGATAAIDLQRLTPKQLDTVVDGLARNSSTGGRFTNRLSPKINKAISKRMWRKVLNAPSLFHPISRISARAGSSVDNFVLARRARKQAVTETKESDKTRQRETAARREVKSKTGGGTALKIGAGAVALQGIMCTVKDLAGILPGAFYATTVMPAIASTVQFQSLSSQLRAGDDFTIEQMGDMISDLEDEQGGTVWQSKPMNALAYGGEGRGEDIDDGAKLAFATRGSSISGLYALVRDEDPNNAGESTVDSVAGWACSTPARWLGLAGGIVLTGISFVGCGATAGTTCAGQAARVGSQAALGIAVFSVVSKMLGQFVEDTASDKVADACGVEIDPEADDGGEGIDVIDSTAFGSCMAYAGRMENNISGASMGFTPLSENDELAILREVNKQEAAEFRDKGLYDRLFDIKEDRSLATALFRSSTSSGIAEGKFGQIASGLLQVPHTIVGSLSGPFSGLARAEPVTYDWGFPAFGMPLNIAEDPKYSDPVANANWILERRDKLDDKRIEKCFGVKLIDGAEGLQAQLLEDEINPLSDEYNDANCGNLDNETWIRTSIFVLDDSIARSLDCYEGNDQVCTEAGFGNIQVPEPGSGTADPGEDTSGLQCPAGTEDGGVRQDYGTDGQPTVKIRICGIPGAIPNDRGVNASIAAQSLAMIEAMRADGLSPAGAAFRSYQAQQRLRESNCPDPINSPSGACSPETAKAGNGMHEVGLAIDFGDMCFDRQTATCPGNDRYDWLVDNAAKYGFRKLISEAWHWSVTGG